MLFGLDRREIVVVGGASGIGAATAALAARMGASVVVADFDAQGAEKVAASIPGGRAETVDVRSEDSMAALFRDRRPAGVVVTPGVNVRKRIAETTVEEFERVVALNLRGSFLAIRHGAPALARAGGGSMVLLSSIRSQVVEPGQGAYAATKAGIVQLVRTAATEFAPDVRVNALAPGVVETPLTGPIDARPDWKRAYADKTMIGRWATADEIAAPAVFLLSDAASYVTGSVLFADGGWTAHDGRFQPFQPPAIRSRKSAARSGPIPSRNS